MPKPWLAEFSKSTYVLPCLVVADIVSTNTGWPEIPAAIATDNGLKAQLIYDFGIALSTVWKRNATNIHGEAERAWEIESLEILAKSKYHDVVVDLRAALDAKNRYSATFAARQSAMARGRDQHGLSLSARIEHHEKRPQSDWVTPIVAEIVQLDSKLVSEDRLREEAVSRAIGIRNDPLISRFLAPSKQNFFARQAAEAHRRGQFTTVTDAILCKESAYAGELWPNNMLWVGKVCTGLSDLNIGATYKISSFFFRNVVSRFERYDLDRRTGKNADKTIPRKNTFQEWMLASGALEGIAPDDKLRNLTAACNRQDALLDEHFQALGFPSFSYYASTPHVAAYGGLNKLLGKIGPGFQ